MHSPLDSHLHHLYSLMTEIRRGRGAPRCLFEGHSLSLLLYLLLATYRFVVGVLRPKIYFYFLCH